MTTDSGATIPLKVDAGVKVKDWVLSFLGGYDVDETSAFPETRTKDELKF